MIRIKSGLILVCTICFLWGCSSESHNSPNISAPSNVEISSQQIVDETKELQQNNNIKHKETVIVDTNWSDYFEGMNGSAVIYDPSENIYQIYNQELANTQRSPCSTFKIISSLIGLENGIIIADDSMREWSGEKFWLEDWNKDISFDEAFRSSCVWYFRELIDDMGADLVQTELEKLQYGNNDISDWDGKLNNNNNNPALTGFWIESSLKISPKEQTEVMERIFGEESQYTEETQNQLKQVMIISELTESDINIYGKTGMGKSQGVVVDAWYTGFADIDSKRVYFCIYLGESQEADVSSTKAKEIATKIIFDIASTTNTTQETFTTSMRRAA